MYAWIIYLNIFFMSNNMPPYNWMIKKHEQPCSGQPVSEQRFEPGTSDKRKLNRDLEIKRLGVT
jgi:hypothetical protein